MKIRVLPVLVLIVLGFGCLGLTAEQDPSVPNRGNPAPAGNRNVEEDPFASRKPSPPLQIQVQVEFVELSHEALTGLLFLAEPKTSDAITLRKQVQELVVKKEAKVIETMIAVCRSGQKATSESIHEFIYPMEFTPMTNEESAKKLKEQMSMQSSFEADPATPTAFETRNVGSTLEIEPTVGEDDKTVDLRLVPELIWHTGNTVWHEQKDAAGNTYQIQMPDFYAVRLNTSITCVTGQYNLLGTQSPKDAKGEPDLTRKVMVFVKCSVLSVK